MNFFHLYLVNSILCICILQIILGVFGNTSVFHVSITSSPTYFDIFSRSHRKSTVKQRPNEGRKQWQNAAGIYMYYTIYTSNVTTNYITPLRPNPLISITFPQKLKRQWTFSPPPSENLWFLGHKIVISRTMYAFFFHALPSLLYGSLKNWLQLENLNYVLSQTRHNF